MPDNNIGLTGDVDFLYVNEVDMEIFLSRLETDWKFALRRRRKGQATPDLHRSWVPIVANPGLQHAYPSQVAAITPESVLSSLTKFVDVRLPLQ